MKVTHLLEKVDLFIDNVDETWLFDDAQENKLIFRPLWMNEDLSHKFLWQHGGKFVLMSASFLPQHILAKTLGIPPEEIDYMCVQSTFPPERRPVSIEPVANLTAKTMELEVPKLINRIREIIDARPGVKGMIHCVSYKLGLQIMQGLKNPRLMIHNSFNRQEILKKFMDSPDSDILISPSMERGVSFEQDLCRFIIVAKAPYKNLGDKIVSARVYLCYPPCRLMLGTTRPIYQLQRPQDLSSGTVLQRPTSPSQKVNSDHWKKKTTTSTTMRTKKLMKRWFLSRLPGTIKLAMKRGTSTERL